MHRLIVFLFLNAQLFGQNTTYWDSIYQLNQRAIDLVDKDLDSAISISSNLFNLLSERAPDSVHSKSWNLKTHISFYQGNYEEAFQSNLKFLELANKEKDTAKILDAIIIMGNINYTTMAYKDAIKYMKQSINLVHNSNLKEKMCGSPYNTLGAIYNSMGNADSAIFYYEAARKVTQFDSSFTSEYLRGIIHDNLGALYMQQKDFKKAEEFLLLGLKFNTKINRKAGIAWCSNRLGNLYLEQNKLKKAKNLFNYVDSIARESSTFDLQKDNKYSIIKYHLIKGGFDTALTLLQQYNALNDSIIQNKTESTIQEMQKKYETEKKEKELILSRERASKINAKNETQKLYLLLALIGILVVGLISFYIVRNSRQKRQISEMMLDMKDVELKTLLANQESESFAAMLRGQEEERERIARDLHDRLGGTLAALKHSLRRPENKVSEEDLKIIDEAVVEVRNTAHNLSSGLLEKQGLNVALQHLKETIERSGQLVFNLYLHSSMAELGQKKALELYRIVQELTNNTLKHAQASEINLQTNVNDKTFNLIYEDNGKGFDQRKMKAGMGMNNLKTRVKKINGTLHIDSEPGRGSITIIELDL